MKKILTICTVLVLAFAMSITLASCGLPVPGGDPTTMSPVSVSNETEWIATVAIIKNVGDNKAWTINVTNSFDVTGGNSTYTPYTFGSVKNVSVTIKGDTGTETISLKPGTKLCLLRINDNQEVIIKDINFQGHTDNADSLVTLESTSTFKMTGTASISGNYASSNWGHGVDSRGTFIMQDYATIHDNGKRDSGSSGGGVAVRAGTFTMKDNAKIYNNITRSGGGGVYVAYGGNFIMQDAAEIYDNSSTYATDGGGGVLVGNGTFTMRNNAKIYNNTAIGGRGGGVSVAPSNGEVGNFTMEGGEIFGNNTTKIFGGDVNKGGGVSIGGDSGTASFRIVTGTIYGTGATEKDPNTVDSGGTGAALYVASSSNTTAQRGTFSGTGGAWVSSGALTTSETTVKVVSWAIQ